MSQHLSREQLQKYNTRKLQPGELLAVDGHLAGCEDCRSQLLAIATPVNSLLSSIRHAASQHLTYEQMDAWVDGELDSDERELIAAHIGLCDPCGRQLKAYESYAPVMSAPVAPPARPAESRADRIRAWFHMPQIIMVATAAALALIVGPIIYLNSPARSDSAGLAELDQLPPSVQSAAKAVITAKSATWPASLSGLAPNRDQDLSYPVSEVIEERQPILRWQAFGSNYDVALFDADHQEIAHSVGLLDSQWRVPMPLERGGKYSWWVRSGGVAKSASFRVLSSEDEAKLAEIRSSKPGSLALGAVAQQLGMLSLAQSEFQKLVKQDPGSKAAEKLLSNVKVLRGK